MFVTKIYEAAMSRADIREEDRQDFSLYVDEFQNFATDTFAEILSEARKYRLNLTIAHQYM
jgi:type IV secretory pathway TraG/TraD family ATPase VirD4